MVIPETFSRRGVRAISSYDYTEIAEGTGKVNYYLAQSQLGNIIVQTVLSSVEAGRQDTVNPPSASASFDLTAFNLPKTIKGVATIQLYTSAVNLGPTLTFQLKKVSATTTNVGSSGVITLPAGTAGFLVELPIATGVNFKKGDILRLTITKSAHDIDVRFGTDPTNLASANIAAGKTKSTLSIPFQLNL